MGGLHLIWLESLTGGALWLGLVGENWTQILWLPLGWVIYAGLARDWTWLMVGVAAPVVGWQLRRQKHADVRTKREALTRLWALVGLYLSAGLGFWSALEEGVDQSGLVADSVRDLSQGVVQDRDPVAAMEKFCRQIPGPESELIATMVEHGYRHGIVVADVLSQAQDLEERLAFEKELRRRQDPLWLTVIPAMMLLNILVLLGAPMAVAIFRNWHGI